MANQNAEPTPAKKPIEERLKRLAEKDKQLKEDPQYQEKLAAWEKERQEDLCTTYIKASTDKAKELITNRPQVPEQMMFSFMPTQLTRTTPFFPMSRKAMKNRPYEELEWDTSWGKMRIEGKRLSIYDESVLLSLLVLVKRYRTNQFETTQNELCKIAKTNTGKNTYKAIWESIKRLAKTNIDLDITEGQGRAKKTVRQMTGTILIFGDRNPINGKLRVIFNPYFVEMYVASFVTNIDLEFRAALKGDIAKALYRFFTSQRGRKYSCHILILAKAVNINIDLPVRKIRERIRTANRELKKKGFLTKAILNKNDIVTVWKAQDKMVPTK